MKHLILTILFTLSLFAQEIGVPYVQLPKDAKELNIGLSRDGKTFYTYENNTLIHWNMNPVQIIDSVKITDPMFPSPLNFDLLPDAKKMVFSHGSHGIGLFDLEKKQFTKKLATRFLGDILIDSDLFTYDKLGILEKIDLNNFRTTSITKIPLKDIDAGVEIFPDTLWGIFRNKNGDRIIVLTKFALYVFNVNSSKQILYLEDSFDPPVISLDKEVINGNRTSFDVEILKTSPLKLSERRLMLKQRDKSEKKYFRYEFDDWFNPYVLKMHEKGSSNVLFWLDNKKFYQLSDGNWFIITPDRHFDGSPESRKYLYIKTKSGESVPIDDATYNKFHKKINLKD
jgi:hypothetical protein